VTGYGNLYGNLLDYVISAALISTSCRSSHLPAASKTNQTWNDPIGHWLSIVPALYFIGATLAWVLFMYQTATTWPGLMIVLTGVPVYFLGRFSGTKPPPAAEKSGSFDIETPIPKGKERMAIYSARKPLNRLMGEAQKSANTRSSAPSGPTNLVMLGIGASFGAGLLFDCGRLRTRRLRLCSRLWLQVWAAHRGTLLCRIRGP